ncbi:MAG: SusD/RagB family nutrient-binding outer membrane lipoprotein [Bacteroidales bacterium]|nr:SusD/RagB family nutrient-binding outer membrane lipoprotein [Bacteroidales bacterium]
MKRTIFIAFVAILGMAAQGCGKIFAEYNKNPNQLEYGKISAVSMLEDVIFYAADGEIYRTYQINGELAQYTVHMYTENIHRYIIRDSYVSGAWNYITRWAGNADHMYELAQQQGDPNLMAIATTLKCKLIADWTDLWGAIPYFEAFQCSSIDGDMNVTPVFDSQEDVYRALLKELSEANQMYRTSVVPESLAASRDILYGGNYAKWQKFTNSLKMRLLMRLSNRDSETGVSDSLKVMLDNPSKYPIFTSRDDAAVLRYSGIEPLVNRFGSVTFQNFTSNARKMAKYFIDLMDEYDDPRIGIFGSQTNSQWAGLVSGYPSTETVAGNAANMNKDVLGDYASPYAFMKYDEVLFILSEAAFRGMIPGGNAAGEEYYNKAVLESIEYWDDVNPSTIYKVTEAQKQQFLAKVAYNGSLEQIMTQKYVAMFWVGYEAYNDIRRTGYPKLPVGPGTANDQEFPTRLVYPISTISTNNDNYKAAVAKFGTDDMHTPVWWSKKAVESGK